MSGRHPTQSAAGEPEPQGHETIRALLPLYAAAAARGYDPARLYPDVVAHVAACARCRDELDDLLAMILPAYAGEVAPAPPPSTPDLSFLRARRAPAAPPWSVDEWGRLLIRFSTALLDSLRPPTLAGARRGQLLYRYEPTGDAAPDMGLQIEIFAESETAASVTVALDDPQREPLAQSGILVTLQAGDQSWQQPTDETGFVSFEGIPRAHLATLQITVGAEESD